MNEKAKAAAAALRMYAECIAKLPSCKECMQVEYEGECACSHKPEKLISMAKLIESMAAELEQVKRERDAAVNDLAIHKFCHHCKHCKRIIDKDSYCCLCTNKDSWEWRRPCEENGGADHED